MAVSTPVLAAYLQLPVLKRAVVEALDGSLWLVEVRRDPATGFTLKRTKRLT